MKQPRKVKRRELRSNDRYLIKKHGWFYLLKNIIYRNVFYPRDLAVYLYTKHILKPKFKLAGQNYNYFIHMYNMTWKNEREVEIPVVWKYLQESAKAGKTDILECGNVLSYYKDVGHLIVDRFDAGTGIINEDFIKYKPKKKFDLIVSISTIEHVGWVEHGDWEGEMVEDEKVLEVIARWKEWLKPEGKIVVTFPLGDHPKLASFVNEGKIKFSKLFCMKRTGKSNSWEESDWKTVKDMKYNEPYLYANAVCVGVIEK